MSFQKNFPGFLSEYNKTNGEIVEAADWQRIMEWLRWYLNYFMPGHASFAAFQQQSYTGCLFSGTNIDIYPRCKFDQRCSLIAGFNISINQMDFTYYNPTTNNNINAYTSIYFSSQDPLSYPFIVYESGKFHDIDYYRLRVREWYPVIIYDLWTDFFKE